MRADLLVVVLGVGSVLLRAAPMLAGTSVGPRLDRLLGRAGTAALAALVAGDVDGAGSTGVRVAMAAALAVGSVLACRGASMLRVIAAGVPVFVAVAAVLPAG